MNFKEISELIKLVDNSSIAEVKISTDALDLTIRHKKYFKKQKIKFLPTPAAQVVHGQAPAPLQLQPVAAAISPSSVPTSEQGHGSAPKATVTNLLEVKSPMVGTFYRSASPDKPAFVSVGDSIQKGSPVCVIEAMKLFNEIDSEISGKIVKVMVEDASPVEYDQVLFLVEP